MQRIKDTGKYEEHPTLGATYQVDIHSTGEKSVEEMVSEHMAKLMEKRKGAKVALENWSKDEPRQGIEDEPSMGIEGEPSDTSNEGAWLGDGTHSDEDSSADAS